MLETDTKAFLKFFNEIKDKTQKASKTLDEERKRKNDLTNRLRQVQEDIHLLQSNVSKNIESLEQYNTYREFLNSLPTVLSKED